ncbi:arsenical pump-driving ATPase [Texcoconibacillus texcoconensis]|uniref:Arsenite-transporting ATPase n=1 Tax=Texcoconibacillus texcoconensis TaxID=1095777 RepID=A0A840QTH3_9BACI|nr:arsenical pump-driving ATPase [Texcoconibacillus texcoconensis]MBB5174665.1 arsenite-transporting ATPase [Texcoconibacillus texcoconensis]
MERLQPEHISHTRHLFFTGKGGVGKTSTACATAVALANQGKRVLIVSTDPASNLQDVFGVSLKNQPTPVEGIDNLDAANLDPEEAARAYREKMIGPYRGILPEAALQSMEEQLSGACTVEIAAFDEFTNLLTDETTVQDYDHIIFDTAPTGHTLRLLQLPSAWSNFIDESTHGASCLGPLSGLEEKKDLYAKTVDALSDPSSTSLILVSRPDVSSLQEAKRAADELAEIGIKNQQLVLNGVFERKGDDEIALNYERKQQEALRLVSDFFESVQTYYLPLVPYNLTGMDALRKLFTDEVAHQSDQKSTNKNDNFSKLPSLIDEFADKQEGVIMTMGKGGVGKTTAASAIAVGLAEKGHTVHLTTTDPAAHLDQVVGDADLPGSLHMSRIDPKAEVETYKQDVLNNLDDNLTEDELAYVKEDLESPCTEEIAIFQAFAKVVDQAKGAFVVIDTAPTGHTLLLLDAAESYHREVERTKGESSEAVKNLLPRLRDPEQTQVVLVTLAEATPVFEASRLQVDLQRANIHPRWWVINQSFYETNTQDPVLKGRAQAEEPWIHRVDNEFAENVAIIGWQPDDLVGLQQLKQLATKA